DTAVSSDDDTAVRSHTGQNDIAFPQSDLLGPEVTSFDAVAGIDTTAIFGAAIVVQDLIGGVRVQPVGDDLGPGHGPPQRHAVQIADTRRVRITKCGGTHAA